MSVLVYTAAIFVSALLLFLVQPMVGKLLLPLSGGSPAVWNTCMLFFQAALLIGYAYAHFTAARLNVRWQSILHLALLALTGLFLILVTGGRPLALSSAAEVWLGTSSNPIVPILVALAGTVGLPFLALSATAPMLQRWFAHTGHPSARDPYFLYAASNAGSLLALLAYPFLIEPIFPLADQGQAWAIGFGLFFGLAVIAALFPRTDLDIATERDDSSPPESLTIRRRAWWVALAAVPSSLLIGVTTYITTDIAPVPLLWVVPLALYLITFIIAFSGQRLLNGTILGWTLALAVLIVLVTLALHANRPVWLLLGLHLSTFFLAALTLHGQLAEDRPSPGRLTEFYLWLSVGGVIGGLVNALAAPMLLRHSELIEYPIALALAAMLRPAVQLGPRWHWIDLVVPALLGAITFLFSTYYYTITGVLDRLVAAISGANDFFDNAVARNALTIGLPAILAYLMAVRQAGYGLALLAVFAASEIASDAHTDYLARERNHFGVVKVYDSGAFRRLVHGSTAHGQQGLYETDSEEKPLIDDEDRWLPLSYYHPTGPIGRVFRDVINAKPEGRRVAAVGLGTGSLAYYAQPTQDWTFYEINPAVEQIACQDGLFDYWSQCRAATKEVILGDARVRLREAPDGLYDIIILDAFSSDAIPVHLLTREALELYRQKLAPGGLIAFHISNRYLDLAPVLARHCADLDLVGIRWNDSSDDHPGKYASEWVVLARDKDDLGSMAPRPMRPSIWDPLPANPAGPLWTDDFSNLWAVFSWGFQRPRWLGGGD